MEIPKIGTGFKALMVAGALQDEGAMGAATAVLAAGIGKKIFGGLFKKKQEDTLERKFEKVLDERKRLFEKNLPESSILGKTKLIIKKIKESLSKFLTAVLAALKTIFTIIKTALITVAKALLALVKWIGKELLRGLLKSLMKLCKSGGFRKMKARIKVFGRKLKRFIKSPAALLIGGIALGMAGYFSAIFKKEKEEIDQIGGEDDEKDTSVSEEAPAKTEEPAPEAAPPAVAPEAAPSAAPPPAAAAPPAPPPEAAPPAAAAQPRAAGTPVPASQAAPPRAAGTPVPASQAAPPRAAGTPVPAAPPPAPPRAAGTPVPAAPPPAPPRAAGTPETSQSKAGTPTKEPGGVQGLIIKALISSGVTSQKAHANILATVKAETNFKVRSEDLTYTTAAYIKQVFTTRIPSLEFAETLVRNPEALANHVYKTTDGNSAPGDGFKYRGRGFIQHTGKNQYIALSKVTGVDLVSNPDALNSEEVAAKAIPWFFLKYKNMKPDDMDDMSKVNRAVAFAGGADKAAKREASAKEIYASLQSSSGTQLPATGEMGQATSGTTLASAGQTQYDKDKNTKTNIVIASKANNKTNNIEDKKAA